MWAIKQFCAAFLHYYGCHWTLCTSKNKFHVIFESLKYKEQVPKCHFHEHRGSYKEWRQTPLSELHFLTMNNCYLVFRNSVLWVISAFQCVNSSSLFSRYFLIHCAVIHIPNHSSIYGRRSNVFIYIQAFVQWLQLILLNFHLPDLNSGSFTITHHSPKPSF